MGGKRTFSAKVGGEPSPRANQSQTVTLATCKGVNTEHGPDEPAGSLGA